MRKIILIFTILCSELVFGQIAEAPQYKFSSTSSYKYTEMSRQYTIPISEVQQPFTNSSPYSPVRRNGEILLGTPVNPSDPGWQEDTPVGDVLVPLIILSTLYTIAKMYKINLNKY